MAQLSILVNCFAIVTTVVHARSVSSAVHLRRLGQPYAASPAPALPPPPPVADGSRLYSHDSCGACHFKAACGCQPALEYLACFTQNCRPSNHSTFAAACDGLRDMCSADVDIRCAAAKTGCTSSFHELSAGGIGFSLDLGNAKDNAFCGPFGKCVGSFSVKARIHKGKDAKSSKVWLECGIPKAASVDLEKKEDWETCTVQAIGDEVVCDLPMGNLQLKADESKKSYCVLTKGKGGKPLTKRVWTKIGNVHEAQVKIDEEDPEHTLPNSASPTTSQVAYALLAQTLLGVMWM